MRKAIEELVARAPTSCPICQSSIRALEVRPNGEKPTLWVLCADGHEVELTKRRSE